MPLPPAILYLAVFGAVMAVTLMLLGAWKMFELLALMGKGKRRTFINDKGE